MRKTKVLYLLGQAHYKGPRDYTRALRYFKKTLFYSWAFTSSLYGLKPLPQNLDIMIYYEVKAYEGLSFVNFYLGELAKADYYNNRFLRGKVENDKSVLKEAVIQFVLTHLERKRTRHNGTGTKNKEDPSGPKFNRLPSPAGLAKDGGKNTKEDTKALNLLPYLTEEQA